MKTAAYALVTLLRLLRQRSSWWSMVTFVAAAAAVELTAPHQEPWPRGVMAFAFLPTLGYWLGQDVLSRDRDRGALVLAELTPLRTSDLVRGAWLGVAGFLLVVNGLLGLTVVGAVPFTRRSHAAALAGYLLPWLIAAGLVPDGMAAARSRSIGARRVLAVRALTIGRVAAAALVPALFLRPEAAADGVLDSLLAVLEHGLGLLPTPPATYLATPAAALATAMAVHVAGACVVAASVARGRLR